MSNISVKVLLFATLRKKYGIKELTVNCDGTISSLVENIAKILGEDFLNEVYDKERGKIRDDLIFAINGRNIKDLKGDINLKDQDTVAIFPPLAGG